MSVSTEITGGDLNALWRTANILLPTVENTYYEQIEKVHKVNDPPDDEKFGKCHPWWAALACQLEQAMYNTARTMEASSKALNTAVDLYTHVDGDNANELNELGDELESIIDREGDDPVKAEPPSHGPHNNLPADGEVHNSEESE